GLPLACCAEGAFFPLFSLPLQLWPCSGCEPRWKVGSAPARCAPRLRRSADWCSARLVRGKIGRAARMAAQMVGALGLTSTAPAAYYVVTGRLDAAAWALWLANWLFAGDQI